MTKSQFQSSMFQCSADLILVIPEYYTLHPKPRIPVFWHSCSLSTLLPLLPSAPAKLGLIQISSWLCCGRRCLCSDRSFYLGLIFHDWEEWSQFLKWGLQPNFIVCLFLFLVSQQIHSPLAPTAFSHFWGRSILQASPREARWDNEKNLDQEPRNLSERASPKVV